MESIVKATGIDGSNVQVFDGVIIFNLNCLINILKV